MTSCSRRRFVSLAAGATVAGALPAFSAGSLARATTRPAAADLGFDLGIASYTLRAFTLDQAIAMTHRLRIRKITLKDMHLPMAITADEMASVHERLKAAGIQLSSCGVVYMTTEEQVHAAFAYARLAGIRMMVGVPEAPLLDLAERKVKETDISLAIHNHGPTDKRFPSPESAYTLIAKMDRRMGLCIDVGHTQRLGLDPAAQVERYFDRAARRAHQGRQCRRREGHDGRDRQRRHRHAEVDSHAGASQVHWARCISSTRKTRRIPSLAWRNRSDTCAA